MKKWIVFGIAAALLAAAFLGCTRQMQTKPTQAAQNTEPSSKKISIVATIFPAYDFARAIVGDRAELTMLIKPGAEVHSFDPTPADIVKIQQADVFVYIGGENDEWVKAILESMDTTHKTIIRLMDCVPTVEEEVVQGMEAEDEAEGEQEDEREGEPEFDEHIWTSPKNDLLMLDTIQKALCKIDPANATAYQANAQAYAQELSQVQTAFKSVVDKASIKTLVFGDRFPFRYFADEFGLTYRAAFNGCSTETEASAETVAYLIDYVNENKIPYVFTIELSSGNIAKAIAEQTGAGVLTLHSCHNLTKDDFAAGKTGLDLMRQNVETLKKGLGEA